MTAWECACQYLRFRDDAQKAEILDHLTGGTAHLWIGHNCAGVTEVTDDNWLHIWEAGGEMQGLLELLGSVEEFARSAGCKGVELSGRKGWSRVLNKFGFSSDGDWIRHEFEQV